MWVQFIRPPIPVRDFDYAAMEDDYEPGRPIGYGRTQQAAIDDLNAQLREMEDADE